MNFCLQCGAPLAPISVNSPNDPPPTQFYREETPTNPGGRATQNQAQPNFSPNYAPPPQKKSNTKIFLVVGGVLSLFLLLIVAGAAIVAYNLMAGKTTANNNLATPTPVRPIGLKTPLTQPSVAPTVNDPNAPGGKFDRIWIDYNIVQKGQTGMRIHTKFSTYNLKDTECYLAVYFQKEDGTNLASDDPNFRSTSGQLALFRLLKPNFDVTDYNDIDVFMPYTEFDVPTGKNNLKIDADLITKDGNLIQHLGYHAFQYEKFAGN
jgi:hypothetical protein